MCVNIVGPEHLRYVKPRSHSQNQSKNTCTTTKPSPENPSKTPENTRNNPT